MPLLDAYTPHLGSAHSSRGLSRAYIFCRGDIFLFRLVSEHRSESDIADTFDVRNADVELVVDHDVPSRINFDANIFEIEAFDIWPAATRITSASSLWTSGYDPAGE